MAELDTNLPSDRPRPRVEVPLDLSPHHTWRRRQDMNWKPIVALFRPWFIFLLIAYFFNPLDIPVGEHAPPRRRLDCAALAPLSTDPRRQGPKEQVTLPGSSYPHHTVSPSPSARGLRGPENTVCAAHLTHCEVPCSADTHSAQLPLEESPLVKCLRVSSAGGGGCQGCDTRVRRCSGRG